MQFVYQQDLLLIADGNAAFCCELRRDVDVWAFRLCHSISRATFRREPELALWF